MGAAKCCMAESHDRPPDERAVDGCVGTWTLVVAAFGASVVLACVVEINVASDGAAGVASRVRAFTIVVVAAATVVVASGWHILHV